MNGSPFAGNTFTPTNHLIMKLSHNLSISSICIVVICFTSTISAQNVAINNTGDNPHASAILDVASTSKGVLVPRMNTQSRVMIVNPAQSLLVYDTDTRSFWFFDGSWREISAGSVSGPAGGDLSGSYPTPNVVKLQNLDVAFGVPFDKQVLKWDNISNNWKGRNDSLFLPHNATFSSNTSLFGITNNSTSNGASAIYGKRGSTGSGITPGATMGVWGDNSNGIGVVGTSNSGTGVYGLSFNNHGTYGYSVLPTFAGVCGSHASNYGIGVLGDIQLPGAGVMGRSTGTSGKGGIFITPNTDHTDTTLYAITNGKGTVGLFHSTNTVNDKPAIEIAHAGNGNGLKVRTTKTGNPANAIDVVNSGNGYGIYSRSDNFTAAKFENTNATNVFSVFSLANNSTGNTMSITSTNTGVTGNVLDIANSGQGRALNIASAKGHAGYFSITDNTATGSAINVQHPGSGRGVEISLTKAGNTQPGLWVNTQGTAAIQAFTTGTTNDAVAIKGVSSSTAQNGIGVLGQGGASDPNGIGVKGIAGGGIAGGVGVLGIGLETNPQAIAVKGIGYTHNEDVGAVTGINMTDGVGVYGESLGSDGIGVVGVVGNTGNHSVAAMFRNNYNNGDRSVIEIFSNGKNNGIFMEHTNLTNTAPLFRIRNSGNGQFLRFENGLGDIKTTLSKEGNLVTDGTITVNTNQGIVRSSTSSQMRTEVLSALVPAGNLPHWDQFFTSVEVNITFAEAFSATPTAYIGNIIGPGVKGCTLTIEDVTTTGCKLVIINYTPTDFEWSATTYKIIAIGPD